MALLVARAQGAIEIVAADVADFTLCKASEVGTVAGLNVSSTQNAFAPHTANEGYFDILFECTGAEAALRSSVPVILPGATNLQLGLGGEICLPVQAITAKELTFFGSIRFHHEFPLADEYMQKKSLDVSLLFTKPFPIAHAVEAFEIASDRSRAVKVQLDFPDLTLQTGRLCEGRQM